MRYRPLGQSGLLVSVVGLGCNNFGGRLDADRTRSVVDAAIDVGITLFDTSDTYGGGGGSERVLGEILGSRRDQVVLAAAAHLAARHGHTPFISAQNHWSLLERQAEADVVPAARHFGLGVLPYFPLANGLLTGKVRQGQPIPEGTRLSGRQGYVTDEK